MTHLLNVWDYREAARRRLPKAFFEFLDRGAEDETLVALNRSELDAIRLKPTNLIDVSTIDTSTSLLGSPSRLPIAIAPTGVAGMMAFRGELAVARAAGKAGIPFTLATSSTSTIESVAAAATSGFWLQLYVWDDRDASYAVVNRAYKSGASALILTVDSPVLANREYNAHNGFGYPITPSPRLAMDFLAHPEWLMRVLFAYWASGGLPRFVNYPDGLGDRLTQAPTRRANSANVTWEDVARFRDVWEGKLVLKGVLNPEDAARAAKIGADAIVVSNHGGRMLDAAPSSISALPAIVAAAPSNLEVLFDSGVRRGSDIFKAIALGAKGVLVGRAPLYGVAAAGEAGVAGVIDILQQELLRSMALCGLSAVNKIDDSCIWQSHRVCD